MGVGIRGISAEEGMECIASSKKTAQNRDSHMAVLAEHFVAKRETIRVIEVKKIKSSGRTCTTTDKHKWYMKDHHDMIRNLLIHDYRVYNILNIIGTLSFTLLIFHLLLDEAQYKSAIAIATEAWGICTVWKQIIAHDG